MLQNDEWDWVDDLPTLTEGHAEDLKIETGIVSVWSSRVTVADGDGVWLSAEALKDGRWTDVPEGAEYAVIEAAIEWYRLNVDWWAGRD